MRKAKNRTVALSIKNKRKRFSDILLDLARVLFVTFVIGYYVTPGTIEVKQAVYGGLSSVLAMVFAIMIVPEDK